MTRRITCDSNEQKDLSPGVDEVRELIFSDKLDAQTIARRSFQEVRLAHATPRQRGAFMFACEGCHSH